MDIVDQLYREYIVTYILRTDEDMYIVYIS